MRRSDSGDAMRVERRCAEVSRYDSKEKMRDERS